MKKGMWKNTPSYGDHRKQGKSWLCPYRCPHLKKIRMVSCLGKRRNNIFQSSKRQQNKLHGTKIINLL